MTKLNDDDDDKVLKDGQSLRVPAFLMDSAAPLHAPGSLPLPDADRASREALYQRRDQKVCDAWKTAPPLDPMQVVQTITPTASSDIYERRDAKLRDAWRSA